MRGPTAKAAAVLIGAGVALTATAAAPAAAAPTAVVVDCAKKAQVRPGSFVIACGDGNNALASLRWAQWSGAAAVGTGRDLVNDCVPDCAEGHFHSYPVSVRLDRARPWPGHAGLRHYTRLTVTYPASRPPHAPRQESFPLWS
ncbi:hypothetical protein [Streptomyces caatingaensis]|uniref:Secreted protein n=1 Tax=Streptomyces caatingaensis TaxID=1678637 RepID=A0A0K9XD92_9ACTN|nr:hypothetical protein [Streptomyces caatingaensis]KNB51389.1 hypothetical protein AC230_13365 [Streptomyces caatingaensis]